MILVPIYLDFYQIIIRLNISMLICLDSKCKLTIFYCQYNQHRKCERGVVYLTRIWGGRG